MSDDDDSCSSSQIWGSRDIPKSHLALTQHTRSAAQCPVTYIWWPENIHALEFEHNVLDFVDKAARIKQAE